MAQGTIVFRQQLGGRLPFFVGMWLLLYYANITLIRMISLTKLNYYMAGLIAVIPITILAYIMQKRIIFTAAIPDTRKLLVLWLVAILAIALINIAVWRESKQ